MTKHGQQTRVAHTILFDRDALEDLRRYAAAHHISLNGAVRLACDKLVHDKGGK